MATANKTRGEMVLTLEGVDYVLRPTHEALLTIQDQTDKPARRLAEAALSGDLTTKEAAVIATEFMRAQGHAIGDQAMVQFNANRVHTLLMEMEGGFIGAMRLLSPLLALAVSGGYTAQGELKAPVTKKKATPTGA